MIDRGRDDQFCVTEVFPIGILLRNVLQLKVGCWSGYSCNFRCCEPVVECCDVALALYFEIYRVFLVEHILF